MWVDFGKQLEHRSFCLHFFHFSDGVTNGETYVGHCRHGVEHGEGVHVGQAPFFKSGDPGRTVGEWKDGQPFTFSSTVDIGTQIVIETKFRNGTFVSSQTSSRDGSLLIQEEHLNGHLSTVHRVSGDVAKGIDSNWLDDDTPVKGCIKFKDGSKYEGVYVNKDQDLERKALRTWTPGDGILTLLEMHGPGTLVSSDGSVFVGHFQHSKKNGRGTLTWAEGKVEQGWWEDDKLAVAGEIDLESQAQSHHDAPVPVGLPLQQGDDVAARLLKLQMLAAQGLISDAEYQEKHHDILATV